MRAPGPSSNRGHSRGSRPRAYSGGLVARTALRPIEDFENGGNRIAIGPKLTLNFGALNGGFEPNLTDAAACSNDRSSEDRQKRPFVEFPKVLGFGA